ncbi:S8 family serine peptidase [Kribbella yunnanensis]|uniref:S8 family serine peptidase n=1 Tax=Kribbella yunnanensis TaxID=190194 RepID=UPI0031DD1B3F
MVSTPRSRRIGVAAVASIAALGIGLSGIAQASATQPRPTSLAEKAQANKAAVKVTLVTGDRVTVHGDGKATVEPGAGRHGIAFGSYRVQGHLYVVPSDVRQQVASGRLDRRLFDVTGLIKMKYDDKSSKAIPVIVTYAGQAKTRAAVPGATVTRQLPVVNGAALSVDKSKAAAFLAGAGNNARSATAIEKIWLNGKRELLLDKSVPQIGAPEAWKAGYTGKGVSVAVLDTGIDATHPDLSTQVAGAKNFTTESADDVIGHGTHVASTIAGTGAASGGKYKGVAPDAKLYDGKVCEAFGCFEDDLLAGMEWAAKEVKAKVVNFSIGGADSPEIDPLEEAVNRLTAETGTLFVIAAGNSGPGAGSVGSPGSAEAALTVGAVDKQDKLAEFSSVGPRVGDGAVKPDVTAPGVDIVAARSKDGSIGTPVGDKYLSLSGTSMATPHTAGAAAILTQQHPNWKAGELKSAITGSAKPAADQTTFQQGAGRIDVAKGIKQTVVSDPGNLSFGTAVWPHNDDEPVTKTLTYRNLGDQPVTLNLAATLTDPTGAAAPAGSLQLSANTVTVPAGGTASVQATSNTKHNGPDGAYSGRVTATGGDTSVVSGIGVNKEVESYNLKVKTSGPDGKPLPPFIVVLGLDDHSFNFYYTDKDELSLRLPKGGYHLEASNFLVDPNDPEKGSFYEVVQPALQLTGDASTDLDARLTKPVKVTVPNAGASLAVGSVGYERYTPDGQSGLGSSALLFDFDNVNTAQIGPALPPEQLTGFVGSQWAKKNSEGRFDNSPYLYAQGEGTPGVFPTGLIRNVQAKELAEVTQQINAASDRKVERVVFGSAGGWAIILDYDQPATTKLLADDKPAQWSTQISEIVPSTDPENPFPDTITQLRSPFREYQAGKKYQERFNAAAFTPSPAFAGRAGNDLLVLAYGLTDADGNQGATRADSEWSKLLRDGKVVAESKYFGEAFAEGLPPEKAKFTFQSSMTRQTYSAFSTRTDLTWTFSSAKTAEETQIPLVGVGYHPKVDKHNVADRKPVSVLPFTLLAQEGSAVSAVKKVELQVSGDNGKTWHKASVVPAGHGSYKAIFATPKGAKTISLKAHVVDAQGNTADQTTIGAYPLR